jgi:hypothetical protein
MPAKKKTKTKASTWVTTSSIDAIPAGCEGELVTFDGAEFIRFEHFDYTLDVNKNYLKLYPTITEQKE